LLRLSLKPAEGFLEKPLRLFRKPAEALILISSPRAIALRGLNKLILGVRYIVWVSNEKQHMKTMG